MMVIPILAMVSMGAPPSGRPAGHQSCLVREVDRIVANPRQARELRRWTRYEATRLLWSLAGDSPRCVTQARITDDTLNAVYRHADRLVARRHLYRD